MSLKQDSNLIGEKEHRTRICGHTYRQCMNENANMNMHHFRHNVCICLVIMLAVCSVTKIDEISISKQKVATLVLVQYSFFRLLDDNGHNWSNVQNSNHSLHSSSSCGPKSSLFFFFTHMYDNTGSQMNSFTCVKFRHVGRKSS